MKILFNKYQIYIHFAIPATLKPKNKSLFPRAYLVDGPILTFSDILTHFIRTPKPVADSSSTLEESRGAEIYHYTTAKVMASQYFSGQYCCMPDSSPSRQTGHVRIPESKPSKDRKTSIPRPHIYSECVFGPDTASDDKIRHFTPLFMSKEVCGFISMPGIIIKTNHSCQVDNRREPDTYYIQSSDTLQSQRLPLELSPEMASDACRTHADSPDSRDPITPLHDNPPER